VCCLATDTYSPSEMASGRGGGGGIPPRTPSTRRTEAMTSSGERSNTLPRTGSHVTTSPLPVHRQTSASNTPPSVSPRQSPTWRRKAYTGEREVLAQVDLSRILIGLRQAASRLERLRLGAWWLSGRALDLRLTGRRSIPGRSSFTV